VHEEGPFAHIAILPCPAAHDGPPLQITSARADSQGTHDSKTARQTTQPASSADPYIPERQPARLKNAKVEDVRKTAQKTAKNLQKRKYTVARPV
jgi:hypothetical protein